MSEDFVCAKSAWRLMPRLPHAQPAVAGPLSHLTRQNRFPGWPTALLSSARPSTLKGGRKSERQRACDAVVERAHEGSVAGLVRRVLWARPMLWTSGRLHSRRLGLRRYRRRDTRAVRVRNADAVFVGRQPDRGERQDRRNRHISRDRPGLPAEPVNKRGCDHRR